MRADSTTTSQRVLDDLQRTMVDAILSWRKGIGPDVDTETQVAAVVLERRSDELRLARSAGMHPVLDDGTPLMIHHDAPVPGIPGPISIIDARTHRVLRPLGRGR